MRNLLKSFAVLAAILSFAACQKEGIVKPDEQTKVTHTVTFVADAPETKTVANIDRENGVVNYEWSSTDEDKDKFHVYENGVEGSVTAVSLVDGKMTISASFTGEEPAEVEYTGYFNEGVKASQQSYNTDYDQDSDVLIAWANKAENNQILFRFQRLGAICEVNLKGLAAGECLKTVKIESLDENVFLAGSIVNGELVGNSKTITIDSYNDITDGVATLRFVSLPIENANLRFIVETTNDGDDVAAKYVKRLGKPITFTQGDLKAFNVSSFSTVETTATFKANGTTVLDAVLYAEGEDIVFPEGQDANAGNIFVGWTKNESYKAATAPSDLCTEDKMGAQSVVYNAVYGSIVGKAENPSRIVKLGASSSFAEGDVIAVFAKSGDNYYGMYQETVSTSYVQYYALNHEPELADFCGSNSDAKKSWNLTVGENSTWYLGDATNKYLRNSTNNLYADAEDLKTATAVSIAWNNINLAFTIKNDDRWIACRADLTGDNQYKYRGAGTSGSPTTNSLAYFDIYKLVDIESYSTTVDTRMNSSLAWSESSCSARMGAANTYPTLTTIPVGLEGVTYASSEESVATISNDGTITLKAEGETTITASFAGNVGYKPAEDASYVLTVLPAPSLHVAKFSVNGAIDEEKNVEAESGSSIAFPADPDGPYTGIVFKGWAKAAIVGTQDEAPEMVNKDTEKMGDEDVTYFAVFATETDDSTTNTFGWEEATTPSDWTIGGTITRTEANASYSANSGSYYGLTNSNSSVQFKNKVKVKSFSYYCVRRTNNTNTSIKIETSTNGSTWTEAVSTTWNTFNSDGKTYKKIEKTWDEPVECYVRVNLVTAANRQLDDVSITYGDVAYSDYCTKVKEPVVLSSIVVSGNPTKTSYVAGDSFEPAGLTVTGIYSDESQAAITEGITWSTPDPLTAGQTSVSITATVNDVTSAAYEVTGLTVTAPATITRIAATGTPAEFWKGESFNHNGITIKAIWSDETETDVTSACEFSGYDMNTPGQQKVTVTYQELTCQYDIEVKTIANTEETAYTVTAAKAIIDAGKDLSTEVYVKGVVSQVDSYNSTYKSITYWLDDNSFEVYGGLAMEGGEFTSMDDIKVGAQVVVKGKIKKFNSTYEFDSNNHLVSYIAPETPKTTATISFSGNLASLQTNSPANNVTVTYNGDGALSAESTNTGVATVSLNGTTLTVTPVGVGSTTITVSAPETENYTSATKSYTLNVSAPAQPASLPFEFDGGVNDIANKQGMSQNGLGSDYNASPKLKFDTQGDNVVIFFGESAKTVTYTIKGNSTSGTYAFDVMESVDGVNYTSVHSHTSISDATSYTDNLNAGSRYVKFVYTTKANGNVALGKIAIASAVVRNYTLTINSATNGSITATVGGNEVQTGAQIEAGTTVTIKANPASDYEFGTWSVTGASVGTSSTESFTMTGDVTVGATFTKTQGGGKEQVYKTALFGSSYNSAGVSSYTGTFSATNDGFKVDLANFNNNNNQWSFVKTGNKSSASVGTITTNAAVDKAVTKVVITIDAVTASSVNSITLYSGTSASNCTSSEGTFTIAQGTQTVTISSPAANKFYKISFDCKKGSSNGLVTVSKVQYYAVY